MPEHIHLRISEPEHGTPSTVVQAIKLGFARRVLGSRKVAVAQTSRGVPHVSRFLRDVGDDHKDVSAEDIVHHRIWQRRFYDFNVWTACKRIEKLGHAPQSGQTRSGRRTRSMDLEQFSRLPVRGTGACARQLLGSVGQK